MRSSYWCRRSASAPESSTTEAASNSSVTLVGDGVCGGVGINSGELRGSESMR